jgi:surfactin synthase thioesterase subunit
MAEADLDRWVRRPPERRGVPLVCLPHAGGAASAYLALAAELGPGAEVWAVQPPGREDRFSEPLAPSIVDLVASLAPALERSLREPYALYGHSMGAIVAFELAHALTSRGVPPSALVVSGCRAPACPKAPPIHDLSDDELLGVLEARFGRLNEALAIPDLAELLLPILRADLRAYFEHAFRDRGPLPVPIVALCGDEDPISPRPLVARWREETSADFELHEVRGGHFFVFTSPDAIALIRDSVERRCDQTAAKRT